MSEIMLNLRDANRAIHNTTHGSRLDYFVAALSADPETIEELEAALVRFLPGKNGLLAGWRRGLNPEPWDAGLAVIDLAARLVVVQSTYDLPAPRGGVGMVDATGREVGVPYHVADDWLFLVDVYQVDGWESRAEKRRRERAEKPPVDTRAVLFGQVCEFIAQGIWNEAARGLDDNAVRAAISAIHGRWLTTPRDDLRGQAPRDVLLAGQGHMSWDLQDRSEQWSLLGTCPPQLPPETFAYRFGGYGTHEIVMYYNLVRELLHSSWRHRVGGTTDLVAETRRLETLRDDWLDTPDFEDLHGRTPRSVIVRERARVPEAVTGAEAAVDHDCPMCQMMIDSSSPFFWNLDGCNMDDGFAFSFHRTREAWEAEQREYEEFSRKFDERRRAEEASGAERIWQSSSVNLETADSPTLMLFGLGAHLAELTQNLKDAAADQQTIDALGRDFGNLRETTQDPTSALVEPTLDKLCQTLSDLAQSHPALAVKCADLQSSLLRFARQLSGEPPWEEDLPF